MTSLDPVAPPRLYRRIADQIAEKIRSGGFAAGMRLPPERELAEQLQVARSTVREALIALELSGHVEVQVGTGVFVLTAQADGSDPAAATDTKPPAAVAASPFELIAIRMLVEPDVAALAAQHATPGQIRGLEYLHTQMAADASPDASDFVAHRAFHEAIAASCGNTALASVVSHLWGLMEASPLLRRLDQLFVTEPVWDIAVDEHDRVLAAIVAGDAVKARHAMGLHLQGIHARLSEDPGQTETAPPAHARGRRSSAAAHGSIQ